MPQDTSVKYLHSDMPGAPQLSYAAGTAIAVLDACLVNGWGLKTVDSLVVAGNIATLSSSTGHSFEKYAVVEISGATPAALNGQHRITSTTTNTASFEITLADQTATGTITAKLAPAGWAKPFSGTNKAAYKSASPAATGCYFRVDDTAAAYCYQLVGYETMTDVDTGTGLFDPSYKFFAKSESTVTTDYRSWFVIANAGMVYIGVQYGAAAASPGYAVACFGDIASRKSGDAYRAFVRGNNSSNQFNYAPLYSVFYASPTSELGCFPRNYTALGGKRSGDPSVVSTGGGAFGQTAATPYPNGPDFGLILLPLNVFETTRINRGRLPGAFVADHDLTQKICASNKVGTFLPDIPDEPGAILAAIPVSYSSPANNFYACFLDIGRPWGN